MDQILVLVTEGKHEAVDYARVCTFSDLASANNFIDSINTGKKKYWVKGEVVENTKQVELGQPEDEK